MDLSTITTVAESQFHIWLQAQLKNDFLIAGIGTVMLSGVMYALKSIPGKVWDAVYHRSTITINVFSDNDNFVDVVTELNANTINFLSRQNILDGEKMSVGLGTSWTRFRGHIVKLDRQKEKSDSKDFKQDLTVTHFFTSKKKVLKLYEDFFEERKAKNKDKIKIYSLDKEYVQHLKDMPKRKREGVFISPDILEHIEKRIRFFQNNRAWYEDRGIPYKYAILLHGVPGTGKTTLAKYIASITNRHVVMVSPTRLPGLAVALNNIYEDDYSSERVRASYLGIMEDIDTDNITAKRDEAPDDDDDDDSSTGNNNAGKFSLITLADLLNAIDGINAPENFILVATTNHLGKLDPALFRKGRFDDVIEIKPLETPEIIRMVKFFFEVDGATGFVKEYEPIPGAVLQDLILQYYDEGVDRVIEVLNEKFSRV